MSGPKCHRSVISLKSFFAVLQSTLHKEFWLLIYSLMTVKQYACVTYAAKVFGWLSVHRWPMPGWPSLPAPSLTVGLHWKSFWLMSTTCHGKTGWWTELFASPLRIIRSREMCWLLVDKMWINTLWQLITYLQKMLPCWYTDNLR